MERYLSAGAGLKKMFIASVGALICLVLLLVPGINLIAGLATIVFAILSLVGLWQAGKDLDGCRTAFILTIIKAVMNVVENASQSVVITVILSLAVYILDILVVYFVCNSVADAAGRMGEMAVAEKGRTVWKLYSGLYVVLLVFVVLQAIPTLVGLAVILSIAAVVLTIAATILYTIFLYQSSNVL